MIPIKNRRGPFTFVSSTTPACRRLKSPSEPPNSLLSRAARRVLAIGSCVVFLACPGRLSGQAPSSLAKTPVLLITIDTLRADHVGCYGYRRVQTPAMDALAARGVRFENAFSQVPITLPSHVAILSGTYPMWNGVHDFTSQPLNPSVGLLAEAFKRQGYQTAAFVSAFVLDSSWGLNRGFETYDDHFEAGQFETRNPGDIQRRGDETVDRLLEWLAGRRAKSGAARPFFVWLHLYDPHSPYDPPEPYHTRYAGHLYDGEVAFADSQLGRLFDYLQKAGIYDRALIVLLSDHGESLGDHGEAEHGFFIYNSTLHVPLIIKPPHGAATPHTVRAPVAAVDVAPTVLDLAHIRDPLSRQFQGISLASSVLGKGSVPARPIYAESYYPRDSFGWSELHSITTDRYHFIEAPHAELYDWPKDPGEDKNLMGGSGAVGAALRSQLLDIEHRFAAPSKASAAAGPPLPPETVERLKSLGYLAYSAPAAASSSGPLPDPKDKLKVLKMILRAEDLSARDRFAESNNLLKTVALEEPKLYLVPFMQAENAAHQRLWDEAEQNFLACLKLNPTFEQAIMGIARAYLNDGKARDARPWLDLALHQNPHNFLAYYALGLAALGEGQKDEALRHFTRATQEKPDYAPAEMQLGILLVEMRRYSEALGALKIATQFDSQNPVLLNFLGTCYSNTNQLPLAVQSYQSALSIKPDYAAARLNLAFAYKKGGDQVKARQEFKTLCGQDASLCRQYQSLFQ
jgi:choline-sulfatase